MRVFFLAAAVSVIASCGLAGKKVTETDCDAWADEWKKVATKELAQVTKDCDLPSSGSDDAAELLRRNCKRDQIGSPYDQNESTCFLGASSRKDWEGCNFSQKSMFWSLPRQIDESSKALSKICDK